MSIRKPYLEGYLLSKENLKLSEFDFMLFSFVFGGTSSKSFVMYILSVDLLQYALFGSFCLLFFFGKEIDLDQSVSADIDPEIRIMEMAMAGHMGPEHTSKWT